MNANILLILSVVFAGSGQVLFKKGMLALGNIAFTGGVGNIVKTLFSIVFSPLVFSGLLLYVLSTLLWLLALSKTELNYAYPFTILTFIIVMLASVFLFQEPLPINRIVGVAVICLGIVISSLKI